MTKTSRKEAKQSSSIHQRVRRAEFVPLVSEERKTFKYNLIHRLNNLFRGKSLSLKRRFNSVIQRPRLVTDQVDWGKVKGDSIRWLIEAFVEGLTANFATWQLLGFKFDPFTILAHGIVIKQGLNIVWRLRYGSTSKIPEKDK